jgi:hypothetical protein
LKKDFKNEYWNNLRSKDRGKNKVKKINGEYNFLFV